MGEIEKKEIDINEKKRLGLLLRTTSARVSGRKILSDEEIMKVINSLSDEALIYARKFESEIINKGAFDAIKERAPEWSDETLIFAAKDEIWWFKEWTVSVLEERIKTLPDETLIETIESKTGVLKDAAFGIIKERMKEWPSTKLIETAENGNKGMKLLAVETMKGKGVNVTNAKVKMLKSQDSKIREIAAKALIEANNEKVIKTLMKVLSEDVHKPVTEAAAEALNSTEEGKTALRQALGLE